MTSMLPPTRDLPPGRHARIRGELEQAVTGRRRRLLFPVLAGVAAVATVVASVVTLQPEPLPPSPAVHITSAPPTTTDAFGVSRKEIETGCMKSTGVQGKATLHQLLEEQMRWALLYTEDAVLVCEMGVGGQAYNGGFGKRPLHLLPGHFSVDTTTATSGGDITGLPSHAARPGVRGAVGRISSQVARVTFTADGQTVDAKIANGTFAVRVYYPSSWQIPGQASEVRAYDTAGNLLGTSTELEKECYFDPATGEVVYGDPRKKKEQCRPASPWK